MSGQLEGRRITVVGAGTRPTSDPLAPVGNGRAIAVRAAREEPRSGASIVMKEQREPPVVRSPMRVGEPPWW